MPIVFGTLISWIAVTAFWLIPKKLTTFEMIFLFFVDTIFNLSVFSILHVNLKYIQISPGADNGISDLMFRLVELPLLLVAASNLLLYSNKFVKWGGVAAIVVFSVMVQQILIWMGMLTLHHWNVLYSGIALCGSIVFSRIMTWVIITSTPKETEQI